MPANMAAYNPGQYQQMRPGPGNYMQQSAYGMMSGFSPYAPQPQGYPGQVMPYPGYPTQGGQAHQQLRQQQPVWKPPGAAQGATETAAAAPTSVKKYVPKNKASKGIRIVNPETKKDVVVETPKVAPVAAAASSTPTSTGSPAGTPGSIRKSRAIKIQRPDGGEVTAVPPAAASKTTAAAAPAAAPKKADADADAPAPTTAAQAAAPPAATSTPASAAEADVGADGAGADGAAAAAAEEPAAPPQKAPTPGPNQWTPSNTAGEKSYSQSFMTAFKGVCNATPPSFREDIEIIMANPAARGGANAGGKAGNFKSGPEWMQTGFSQQSGGFRPPQRNGSNNGRQRAPNQNDRGQRGGPQQPRAGQKVINLPGRGRNGGSDAKLQKSDNAFVISKKSASEKDTFKEITVRLNKLTLEKFDILALQIKDLLVADLEKVQELVKTIFEKAIDEEFFSMIYAKLCKYLAIAMSSDDPSVEAIPMFRKTLLNCCQQEFERATQADAAASKLEASKKEAAAAAEKAEGEAGGEKKEVSKEEAAKKRAEEREEGYARNKVKRHMLGNIRFIGELFKEDLVSSMIMLHCINHLMPNKHAEEANMEALCKLLDTAGGKWEKQMLKAKKNKRMTAESEATVKRTFSTMVDITVRPGLSPRIKRAILDILDLKGRGWKMQRERTQYPFLESFEGPPLFELHGLGLGDTAHVVNVNGSSDMCGHASLLMEVTGGRWNFWYSGGGDDGLAAACGLFNLLCRQFCRFHQIRKSVDDLCKVSYDDDDDWSVTMDRVTFGKFGGNRPGAQHQGHDLQRPYYRRRGPAQCVSPLMFANRFPFNRFPLTARKEAADGGQRLRCAEWHLDDDSGRTTGLKQHEASVVGYHSCVPTELREELPNVRSDNIDADERHAVFT